HEHEHPHPHADHEHDHHTGHEHAHHHHTGQRGLNDISRLITDSGLPAAVQHTSLEIFRKLAAAEAKVHGIPVEEVHFHEVGAVDSILDIVGAAVGLHYFDVEQVYASALPLGSGQVNTQHGLLPLPAPATLELLRMAQAPVVPSPASQEMITPTGAAILASLATFSQPEMTLQRVGMGAGRRDLDWPNVLRVMIGDARQAQESHIELESNIDDMNPQVFGHVMAHLFQAGALDVYFTPIYMKKNRPATRLSVIARREDEQVLSDLLLRETSTLGVRVRSIWRHEAQREMRRVTTRFGDVSVKVKSLAGDVIQVTPEYDDCVRLAEEASVPVLQVIQETAAAGLALLHPARP
ncbi:MAG: nickel pincer cofactor biosynthesis protein LarC, partial [Chloroflexi bacterium]|nr:nickel pincer cofactor biosynthesis protein LarC [Chloroflexota bacterium]